MKIKLFVLATICVSALSQAKDVVSPDGKYAVRAEETITLVRIGPKNPESLWFTMLLGKPIAWRN
jgi:hypothetical protein